MDNKKMDLEERNPQTDEEILAVLEQEANRLIEESEEITDTKVEFIRKHIDLLRNAFEIKHSIERLDKKLQKQKQDLKRK